MFDLSLPKLLILAVLALVVFGPNELPKMASKAGVALRELRKIAEGAKSDLRAGLGPEYADFDFDDLHPRRFVQKHLFSEENEARLDESYAAEPQPAEEEVADERHLAPVPAEGLYVFDSEAT